jgi:N-acetylmuramic acid 6-phosphate etherase
MEVCGVDRDAARHVIAEAGGFVKIAIVMLKQGVDRAGAERLLAAHDGYVRRALGEAPPPVAIPSDALPPPA